MLTCENRFNVNIVFSHDTGKEIVLTFFTLSSSEKSQRNEKRRDTHKKKIRLEKKEKGNSERTKQEKQKPEKYKKGFSENRNRKDEKQNSEK